MPDGEMIENKKQHEKLETLKGHYKVEDANEKTKLDAAFTFLEQASNAAKFIKEEIKLFDKNISLTEELGMIAIGGPAGTVIYPEKIEAVGADCIRFTGVDNEKFQVMVIQHMSQLNIMLKAQKAIEEPARRIGFL